MIFRIFRIFRILGFFLFLGIFGFLGCLGFLSYFGYLGYVKISRIIDFLWFVDLNGDSDITNKVEKCVVSRSSNPTYCSKCKTRIER